MPQEAIYICGVVISPQHPTSSIQRFSNLFCKVIKRLPNSCTHHLRVVARLQHSVTLTMQ